MAEFYIIPVFVPHKGCPHDCIFCNQKKITGMEKGSVYESNSGISAEFVQSVIDTHLASIHGRNSASKPHVELSFFGGSFTAIPMCEQNELLAVAKSAKDHGKIDAIRLSTRPDCINREILDNLKKHSVDIIELGVQSMDDDVLAAAERGHDSRDVRNASGLIKEMGFTLGLQMMIGLPMDTLEKDLFTATEIVRLAPDFVRIYPTLVIKATKLEQDYYDGRYIPPTLQEAVEIAGRVSEIFIHNDIQVIRLGLQATEQINLGGDVVAGPFHPAFRELVEGKLLNDMLEYGIKKWFADQKDIKIEISPKDISRLYADKKTYFIDTVKNLFDKRIEVRQNSTLDRMSIRVSTVDKARNLSVYEFINWKYQEGFLN